MNNTDTEFCIFCDSPITQSPVDGAWEDSSGACGCGRGEHMPLHWRDDPVSEDDTYTHYGD
jgi:hypothetical protein